jgi:SAM-dependent methyltransferase
VEDKAEQAAKTALGESIAPEAGTEKDRRIQRWIPGVAAHWKSKSLAYMLNTSKLQTLKDIFGATELNLETTQLVVDGQTYPIINDVIILLDPSQYPSASPNMLGRSEEGKLEKPSDFAEDIQSTFGEEWQEFPRILPEHEADFRNYFDLVDLEKLKGARVCDLGCGIGRWSYFLAGKCRELVLVDFSDAIFVARRNLADADNAFFFMADLKRLPFRKNFADFLFCLGVLHHLPTPAIDAVRALEEYAPRLLIYLYYSLDNRPFYFKILLSLVTGLRLVTCKVRSTTFRSVFTWLGAVGIYLPLVFLAALLRPLRLSSYVPLSAYQGKKLEAIRQDVYDRFFTRIEQRHSRRQIMELEDSFSKVIISDKFPYWHFLCVR